MNERYIANRVKLSRAAEIRRDMREENSRKKSEYSQQAAHPAGTAGGVKYTSRATTSGLSVQEIKLPLYHV